MNAKDKFPKLTLMQCGDPEEGGDYLVLVEHGIYGLIWCVDKWFYVAHTWMIHRNVVAWQPLPPIPTPEELEQLYKSPIPDDE